MAFAHNGDVAINYEVHGPESGPVVILIEGFTVQLVGWRPEFVDLLVEAGLRVVLFDNRDVGLSDKLPGVTYTIADMAKDVVAVADAVGASSFHVVGQSLGGMIGQQVLAANPDRVSSLTLVYTSPAWAPRWLRNPDDEQVGLQAEERREAAIEASVARERVSASPGYQFDEAWVRELAALQYDRCYDPTGYERQLAAIDSFVEGPQPSIAGSTVPAAIIHGTDDGYFLPESAFELYKMLPNSELHLYPGMGHELVKPLLGAYSDTIARTVYRADEAE